MFQNNCGISDLWLRWRLEKQSMVMDHRSGCLRCLPENKPLPILHLIATSLRGWCEESTSACCIFQSFLISQQCTRWGGWREDQEHPTCEKAAWIMQSLSWHVCVHDLSFTSGEENARESKYLLWAGCENPESPQSLVALPVLWLMKHRPDATAPGRRTFNCMLSCN